MNNHNLYRVLLVDDDPIMLAGIKQLIDWEKNNCEIAGTASTTAEALEKLKDSQPDVVISDIVMPGLSGIDLLKQAHKEFPDTVFLMLSNRGVFELARESLHYQAVEYLTKANLKSETLEKTLARAISEREKRNKLRRVAEADKLLHTRQRQTHIRNAVEHLLCCKQALPQEDRVILHEEKMLSCFAFAFIPLDFSLLPDYPGIDNKKLQQIVDWEIEIAERLADSIFPHAFIISRPRSGNPLDCALKEEVFARELLLFAWDLHKDQWELEITLFSERLIKTSEQITRLGADVLASDFYPTLDTYQWKDGNPAYALHRIEEQYCHAGGKGHSDAVQKAIHYILTNVEKRIMLQDVADFACVSSGYLSTLFKREYQQNLVDFVNQTKIDRACELLQEKKLRINEISYMLGYENAYYFTRVFRNHTGMTPSEFRERPSR